uniref:Uncharacterized protein n=1 Tax=Anguilla anguilla TaxID=7936 RepID=A0A0E9XPX9_ANGAN
MCGTRLDRRNLGG